MPKENEEKTKEPNFVFAENMTFGQAIEAAKRGERIARKGWNGKFIFLFSQSPFYAKVKDEEDREYEQYLLNEDEVSPLDNIGFDFDNKFYQIEDFLLLKTANNTCIAWNCSKADMLAEDWYVVTEEMDKENKESAITHEDNKYNYPNVKADLELCYKYLSRLLKNDRPSLSVPPEEKDWDMQFSAAFDELKFLRKMQKNTGDMNEEKN